MKKRSVQKMSPTAKEVFMEQAIYESREHLRVNLVSLRAAKRLSQRELSVLAGIGRSVITKLETGSGGDVQISALARIAAAVDCSVADLFQPTLLDPVSGKELLSRLATPRSEWIAAEDLIAALREAQIPPRALATRTQTFRGLERRPAPRSKKGVRKTRTRTQKSRTLRNSS